MPAEVHLLALLFRMVRLACWSIAWIIALGCIVWAFGALHYDFSIWKPPVAWAFAAVVLAAVLFLRGAWRKLGATFFAFALVLAWWLTLKPTNDAAWQPDVAKVAWAEIDGDEVTLHNVRNCDYRTKGDFTPRWETRTVRVSQITGIDLAIDYWGLPWLAHPIVSFQFADAPPVCFSIETRMKLGQTYSAIGGLYRQYELIYIVADERDVIRVRTNCRDEDIYLYRTTLSPAQARERFLEYLHSLNEMRERPRWYNAITANCTTSIRAQHSSAEHMPWDWRILLNGKGDEMMFENRTIAADGLTFSELRQKALINAAAKAADKSPGFSRLIREGRPGFALPPGRAKETRQ
ncbi:MAG: DUF4105 domain-containing protein [Verrucomicrobiae bacterium]